MQLELLVIDDTELTGDVYAAVRFSDRANVVELPSTVLAELGDLLFPDVRPDKVDIGIDTFPQPRGKQPGDLVVRWRR